MDIVHRFKRSLSNRIFTGTLIFVAFLYIFEECLFDFPQLRFFQIIFTFRPPVEVTIAVGSAVASLVFCYAFVWMALVSPRSLKALYVLFYSVSSLVQYGFWKAVNRFMISADLAIAAATPFATWRGAGILFFDWRFILPVAVFLTIMIIFGENRSWRAGWIGLAGLTGFLLLTGFFYTLNSYGVSRGASVSSFFQTITEYTLSEMFPSMREQIHYVTSTAPQNNIVLVIDESIRGDHISVNGYPRPTTPVLDGFTRSDFSFYNWGVAVAGGTCSHTSNSLLLTGVRPGFDDFELTKTHPTLFQYAKAMGYNTYYMDAQTNSFWNGLTNRDVTYLDVWVKADDLGNDIQSDLRAADMILQIVSSGSGKLIVLNKRGVHFLYEDSYPPEAAIWGPVPGEYVSQPELVKNPYDNGVRYNVNTFFERLLVDLSVLDNTIILYTSDHGQTLFENGANWAHCNYTPQEAMVPLIMIGKNLPSVDTKYRASHQNVLPTLLDLMGVPPEQRMHEYAPSLFTTLEGAKPDRFFLDGALRLIDFPDP